MDKSIVNILDEMADVLNITQQQKLKQVLLKHLAENRFVADHLSNHVYQKMFLDAKKIEGCSGRTINYYNKTLNHFFQTVNTNARQISTEQIRKYLADYQLLRNCSNTTIDNI